MDFLYKFLKTWRITHTMFDVLGMDRSNYIQVLMNPNYWIILSTVPNKSHSTCHTYVVNLVQISGERRIFFVKVIKNFENYSHRVWYTWFGPYKYL